MLFLGSALQAQHRDSIVRAEIPFSFTLAGQSFPPGEYSWVSTEPYTLTLRDQNGRILTTVLVHSVESDTTPDSPRVRFYVEGDRHELAEVWEANNRIGYQLPRRKQATMLARRGTLRTVIDIRP